jgi:N-acetyl sugar amidotransferase
VPSNLLDRKERDMEELKWCSTCLNMSTRPRIEFDSEGRCNACVWAERKRSMDWTVRSRKLEELLERYRAAEGGFDCLVPVSGGKDGSYVSHQLKHVYGMNPLTVTVRPALSLPVGDQNLSNFIASGYDHIHISPNPETMRVLNRVGLVDMGFPYFGWLIAIQTAVIQVACNFGLSLIFYGEEGEIEYGGSTETSESPTVSVDYMKRVFLEDGHDLVLDNSGLSRNETALYRFPSDHQLSKNSIEIAHWSFFENWDPYRNYLVAKEFCGLQEAQDSNSGTFTNFAQNDQALYALHVFLMYLKFGFGRATQDAGIEIRRGAMTRDQGLNLVRLYDGLFPEEFLPLYLEYFDMSEDTFIDTLDRWANRELFRREGSRWTALFSPE